VIADPGPKRSSEARSHHPETNQGFDLGALSPNTDIVKALGRNEAAAAYVKRTGGALNETNKLFADCD
jgi:hypothetical protein